MKLVVADLVMLLALTQLPTGTMGYYEGPLAKQAPRDSHHSQGIPSIAPRKQRAHHSIFCVARHMQTSA